MRAACTFLCLHPMPSHLLCPQTPAILQSLVALCFVLFRRLFCRLFVAYGRAARSRRMLQLAAPVGHAQRLTLRASAVQGPHHRGLHGSPKLPCTTGVRQHRLVCAAQSGGPEPDKPKPKADSELKRVAEVEKLLNELKIDRTTARKASFELPIAAEPPAHPAPCGAPGGGGPLPPSSPSLYQLWPNMNSRCSRSGRTPAPATAPTSCAARCCSAPWPSLRA